MNSAICRLGPDPPHSYTAVAAYGLTYKMRHASVISITLAAGCSADTTAVVQLCLPLGPANFCNFAWDPAPMHPKLICITLLNYPTMLCHLPLCEN